MRFEVKLPAGIDCWALRAAGLDADAIAHLSVSAATGKIKLPQTHQCACILPDTTGSAAVTIFSFGQHERIDRWIDQSGKLVIKRGKRPKAATRLQIEINNEAAGR